MFLSIDPSSGVPIYRQIVEQIRLSIARGALREGDRLPSVRQLALDVKVNPTTIVKAYSELEHAGVIHTRRGMGTFVAKGEVEVDGRAQEARLRRMAERLALEATHFGWPRRRVIELLEDRLEQASRTALESEDAN